MKWPNDLLMSIRFEVFQLDPVYNQSLLMHGSYFDLDRVRFLLEVDLWCRWLLRTQLFKFNFFIHIAPAHLTALI